MTKMYKQMTFPIDLYLGKIHGSLSVLNHSQSPVCVCLNLNTDPLNKDNRGRNKRTGAAEQSYWQVNQQSIKE